MRVTKFLHCVLWNCAKLLDNLKERRGYSHLKEEALDRTMWRSCFGRSFGPVVRQTTKRMNYEIPACKFKLKMPTWQHILWMRAASSAAVLNGSSITCKQVVAHVQFPVVQTTVQILLVPTDLCVTVRLDGLCKHLSVALSQCLTAR
jgi:hypothetical protein